MSSKSLLALLLQSILPKPSVSNIYISISESHECHAFVGLPLTPSRCRPHQKFHRRLSLPKRELTNLNERLFTNHVTTDINYPQNIDPFDPGPFAAPLLSHAAVSRQHSIDLFDSGQIIIFLTFADCRVSAGKSRGGTNHRIEIF